jgi:hypothetical protein
MGPTVYLCERQLVLQGLELVLHRLGHRRAAGVDVLALARLALRRGVQSLPQGPLLGAVQPPALLQLLLCHQR